MKTRDRWTELCATVASDDSLPTRDVGSWTEDKLYFWHRYLAITTNAMVGKPTWPEGLVYVDLFAGPGVCTIRENRRRIPGSVLIAANAPKQFRKILAVEQEPKLAAACEARLKTSPAAASSQVVCADCNTAISQVVEAIPNRALTLAFIDPAGLDARFETVARLADCGRVDLLILFADAYDIVRNVDRYEQLPESKLDQVLGPDSNWRDGWSRLQDRSGTKVREFFADVYEAQLKRLGYQRFGLRTIESQSGPLYRLVYASKHTRGLDFWEKALAKDKGGQGGLFG